MQARGSWNNLKRYCNFSATHLKLNGITFYISNVFVKEYQSTAYALEHCNSAPTPKNRNIFNLLLSTFHFCTFQIILPVSLPWIE